MKVENLGELKDKEDTIIFYKIFESQASFVSKKSKFNSRKRDLASSFNWVHCNKSKCFITLLTISELVKLFEKKLIGGFSAVNTRLAFDLQIF